MRILIATDGSQASESVIETARQNIADEEDTEVKILSVVAPILPLASEPFAISGEYYAEVERGAYRQAENFAGQAAQRLKEICPHLDSVSSQVLRGSPAQEIVETAREWGADLIVVGSHGYGFWSRAILGSVSNSVVNHAPCSVLVVRGEKYLTKS